MFGRLFSGLVIVFWMLTMTWLVTEKVIPPLLGGDPPDYQSALVSRNKQAAPDVWKLRWNGKTVGYAASRLVRHENDYLDQCSYVEFEDLPLESLLSELLGPLSAVVKPFMQGNHDLDLDMLVATRMRFDVQRRLMSFDTTIDLTDFPDFLKVRGDVHADGNLELIAQLSAGPFGAAREFRQNVQLPPEALVEGSLSPRSELKNLRVGQTWTIPVFRAFPPNSPVQIVQAEVKRRHQIVVWENEEVETFQVVYHADSGSGVNAARRPLSREWIRTDDGMVVRREIRFSGVEVVFERERDSFVKQHSERLDELTQRLWKS
jgi:hypothetical protein